MNHECDSLNLLHSRYTLSLRKVFTKKHRCVIRSISSLDKATNSRPRDWDSFGESVMTVIPHYIGPGKHHKVITTVDYGN